MTLIPQASEQEHMQWLSQTQRFGVSHLILDMKIPSIVDDLLQVEVLDKEGQLVQGLAAHYEMVIMRNLLQVLPTKRQSYSLGHLAMIGFYQSVALSMAKYAKDHREKPSVNQVNAHVMQGMALLPFQYISPILINSFQTYLRSKISFIGCLADALSLDDKIGAEIKRALGKDKTFALLRGVTHLEVHCGRDYFREVKKAIKADKETTDFLGFLCQCSWSGKSVGSILAELQYQEKNDKPFAKEFKMVWDSLRANHLFAARRQVSLIPPKEIKEFEKSLFE